MRIFVVAATLLFAVAPTHAAGPNFGDGKNKEDKALEARRQAEQDQAYKSSIQRIPAKQGASDPWGSVRPAEVNPSSQSKPKKQ